MKNSSALLIIVIRLLFTTSCATSDQLDYRAQNQFVTEFYAWVEDVEQVRFKSYAGQAAVIGAADGLLHNLGGNRDDMLAGIIVGGLFGGLITSLFEGSNRGYEYQLAAIDGDFVTVIFAHKPVDIGQCVSVLVAGSVKISLESDELCELAEQDFAAVAQ